MSRYSLRHLPDSALLHELKSLVTQDRATTAMLIAHLGEVDARRLYAPAGYPSMFEWCVRDLHFSEDMAFKRIRVARAARQFPRIYDLLSEGQLHLTAVVLLAPHLSPENANELLTAATHRTKAQVEQLLAERFPQPDLPTLIEPIARPLSHSGVVPEPFNMETPPPVGVSPGSSFPSPAPVAAASAFPAPTTAANRVQPLAPQRYAMQCTVSQETHDKLRYAQALLGHAVPSGDLAQVLDRALDALIEKLEQQKFAKTDRPRPCRRSDDARHIPASVKRAVWERDGRQCTYVGENGHRCESRTRLEFDHVEPVATGGHATVQGLRLRCRAHNHLEAEHRFGRDFMNAQREWRAG